MELLAKGKTKDVYELPNGNLLLQFKDTVTGKDGVFDPGANQVGLTVDGAGHAGLRLTRFFFEAIKKHKIPTHFVDSNEEENTMEVKKAEMFGNGIEVICRYKAVGSFHRRYGMYVEEGADLPAYVEITLKDDERQDPLITKDGLEVLGIMSAEEYEEIVELTRRITEIVSAILAQKELTLYDIKLEFGRTGEDGAITLIDEISGGNMRVYKGDEYVNPLNIPGLLLDE
ncbi:MAG: phosphoribosylaminoimidazolesuccinocarboxamide synthase [Tissierellia bacterium]|jgi:phosphoribosylaminoimidazole-succinocarboxamide synthase|nr:phosphoribosylaminoimidazolesuccinocarboxamide synthase [Bacillota bacterium]NLK57700.1 phosphoribosylaminoimidazolesuccinocarboxamide synthase [Tissierellia bacterium]